MNEFLISIKRFNDSLFDGLFNIFLFKKTSILTTLTFRELIFILTII